MKKRIYLFGILYILSLAGFGQDVTVLAINNPGTACGHTNSETVNITVFNLSAVTTAVVPYTITYVVNGDTTTVTITGAANNIPPSSLKPLSFGGNTANMSAPGVYNFKAWINLPADANKANDTAFKVVNSDPNTVPGILNQSDTVCEGANGATLNLVGNIGGVVGWLQSINDGATWTVLPGPGTDSSFTYSNLSQTTWFTVVVRSGSCPFDSASPAIITVDSSSDAGTITGPGNVCINSSGSLTLTGNTGSVVDWETAQNPAGPWTGASNTTTTFNYTNIQATDDTLFRVIVKLGVCPEDTSSIEAITLDPPSIGGTVAQTVGNDTVCSGSNTGTLTLSGHTGTVVRWEFSTGGPFTPIAGTAGLTSIVFTNITATRTFRAVVQSGACPTIVSTTFTITVNAATQGGSLGGPQTVCEGSGGALSLTGNVGQVVRWEQSINGGGTFTTIPGETGLTYTYANLTQTTIFRVQVKNGVCPMIPSATATRTVSDSTIAGTVSVSPLFDTVCAGNNSALLTYAGGNGTVVDWEESTNGGVSFTSVPGPPVTNSNYTFNNITTTTLFRVVAQNVPCSPEFSNALTITVLPASVPGSISGASPICSGSSTTLTLTGSSGSIVTWRVSTNGGTTFNNVAASAGQTSIAPTVSANSLFQVIVQNGGCESDTTTNFAVNVDAVTVPGTVTSSASECGGNNGATLTLAGNTGNIIDWIQSINGGTTWTSVPGPPVVTNTYNYSNLTQTTLFKARVKSGVCAEDSSTFATISVVPAAVGGIASLVTPNDSICASTLPVTVSLSGQTGTVVGWEASENGGATFTIIPGASGALTVFNYTFTTNTLFRALVRNGVGCDTIPSTSFLITVGSSSDGGNTAGTDTVCGGSNNGFITLSGNNGDVVHWEASTNGGVSWSIQPNSDSVVFNYVGLNNTTLFRAFVQDVSCPGDYSDTVQIVIIPAAIGGTVSYAGPRVCAGSSNFTLNLSGSSGTILRWERSLNGIAWTNIPNTITSLNDSDIVANTLYRAVLQSGACPEVFSTADTVFVDQQSVAGIIVGSATHCDTGNTGLVLINSFTGSVTGWQSQFNGGGFSTIGGSAGQDTVSYTNLPAGAHQYKAIVKNGVCPADTSLIATIQVDPNVNPGTLVGGTSYCTFTNSTLLQLNGYTSSVVRWQRSVNGGTTFTNITGTVGRDTVTFVNVSVPTIYRVIVSSGVCGNDTSNTQTISVGQSIGGTLSQSDSVCISGHTGLLQVSGTNGSIVTWQDSTVNGSWTDLTPNNAGIDTLRYTNLTQTTSFRVAVQSGTCDTSFSNFVTITVSDTVFAGILGTSVFLCDTTNSDTLLLSGYFGPIRNWQVSINGGLFTDFFPVKTDSAFIFTNLKDSSSVYRVIMDGGVCGSDTSNTVAVEVGASLSGILAFGDTVCLGNNQGVIRLTNYQGGILSWDSAIAGGSFSAMNYTIDSLIYVNIEDTITYRVRVQNTGCPSDTSNEVTILSIPGTNSGVLTGSRSFCTTTNSDSVILVGRTGNILLWESSINGGASWDTILGQTDDTLIFNNLVTTTMYRVIIEAAGICPNDTSNVVTIQIGPSDAGIITGDTLLCAGSEADLFLNNFLGSVLGWQSSTDGVVWAAVASSDTSEISIILNQTSLFRAIVRSDTCDADTSSSFTVNIDQPFIGSLITPTVQLCYGIGADTIFISDTVDIIFDWELRSDTSASFTSLSNTNYFQTFSNLIVTTHYRAFVKNGVCPIDTAEITLIVDTFTVAGSIAAPDTVCSGDNSGTLAVSGFIGNTFSWQSSVNGNPFSAAQGATNDSFYVYTGLTDTTIFRLVLASGGCPPDTTNSIEITVKPSAIGGTVLSDTSYCKVPNSGVLNLTGYFGNIVGWQQSINGSGFVNVVPPIITDELTYLNIDTTTSYRVILSFGDCPNDTSAPATITILRTPNTTLSANGPLEFCEPGEVVLTATGGPEYSWSSGDTVSSITVTLSGTYVVLVTDTGTGCSDSDSLEVIANPLPTVSAGNDVIILEGQSTALSATGALSYEWSPKATLSDGFIPNPIATPSDSTVYIVTGIDENGCIGIDSIIVGVIPGEEPGPPTFTNLFTPNGDGINDFWKIRDLAGCNTCNVAIYNRYGQQVLSESNYQDDWEGTFNGAKLPDGTYYYVVETETGKIFKGAITILRGE